MSVPAVPSGDGPRSGSVSWIDHLLRAVQRARIPNWAFYAGLFAVGHALVAALRMADGAPPRVALLTPPRVFLVWTVYLLAMTQYLNAVARDRMARFRPALDLDDAQVVALTARLTTMPAGPVLAHGLAWMAVGAAVLWALWDRVVALGYPPWEIGLTVAAFFVGGGAIYHTVHQLRQVSRLLARVERVDLYRLDPVHAFAGLTAQSALGWIALLYATTLLVPRALWVPAVEALWAVVAAVAAAAFVVPLLGMHRRLAAAKHAALVANGSRMRRAMEAVHAAIDAGDGERLDSQNKVVATLAAEKDRLARLSTWPWEAGTLRGFVTALLLPLLLRLGQQALERVLGMGR